MQRHSLLRHTWGMIQQSQLMNQLVPLQLMLPAERIRIRSLLDLVPTETVNIEPGAARGARLIDHASERGRENLPLAVKDHRGLRQRNTGLAPEFSVDTKQQCELFVHAHRKRINLTWRGPGCFVFVFGSKHYVTFLGQGAGSRDFHRERGGGLDPGFAQIVGGGESPTAFGQYADAQPRRFGAGYLARFTVLRGEITLAAVNQANIGISNSRPQGGVQRFEGEFLHQYLGYVECGLGSALRS